MKSPRLTKHFRNAVAVFEGGGVRGAAYAGAYAASQSRGVRIRAVAGTSAGSIAAALVSAGFSAKQMEELFKNDFLKNLLAPPIDLPVETSGLLGFAANLPIIRSGKEAMAYRKLGQYSSAGIEHWLNKILSEQLKCPGKIVKFGQLTECPLYVVAANIREAKLKIWSTFHTPEDPVAFAVRSSCSIPFFFQPASDGTHAFVDGGILSNLPVQVAGGHQLGTENLPIVAFRLQADPEMYPTMPGSSEAMLKQIVDTVISAHSEMEIQMAAPCAQISIPTGNISSTNFELTKDEIQNLIDSGAKATNSFFDDEDAQVANLPSLTNKPGQTDRGMWLDKSMQAINGATEEVVLFGGDCSWIMELGPCLMLKKHEGLKIGVIFDADEQPQKDPMKIMPHFGCDVRKSGEKLWIRGALIDPNAAESTVILSDKNPEATSRFGRILHTSTDRRLIEMIKALYLKGWEAGQAANTPAVEPKLQIIPIEKCVRSLRKVPQYNNATISYELVSPHEVCWSTTALEPFKLNRVRFLVDLLGKVGIDRFKALLIQGTAEVIGPPIVEELGDGTRVVIDGHHRLFYCIENQISQVSAIVLKGVTAPLPSSIVRSWAMLRVLPHRLPRDQRYKSYKAEHWRNIRPALDSLGAELFRR